MWMEHILFLPSAADGHVGRLFTNLSYFSAAIHVRVPLSVWTCVFGSLGHVPTSDVARSHGHCFTFGGTGKLVPGGYGTLPSPQQSGRPLLGVPALLSLWTPS